LQGIFTSPLIYPSLQHTVNVTIMKPKHNFSPLY
jgi:hypothetical protein